MVVGTIVNNIITFTSFYCDFRRDIVNAIRMT